MNETKVGDLVTTADGRVGIVTTVRVTTQQRLSGFQTVNEDLLIFGGYTFFQKVEKNLNKI